VSKPCDDERRQDLLPLVESFFVLGLEYARMRAFGVTLNDGSWEYVGPSEQEALTQTLLDNLATRAMRNLARMTVYPGETAAMTPAERHRAREARRKDST